MPTVQVPRAPSMFISTETPKLRVPFLSLLVEPRPLKKWLAIWALCLYLAFCFGCFFYWEVPRLNHDNYVRFGADSPTYWDAVKYREEHAEHNNLVSFSGNLLGPVFIGMIFRTGLGVAFFNILLFFISVEIACTIPGVDRYRLVFLLAIVFGDCPCAGHAEQGNPGAVLHVYVRQVHLLGETFLAAPGLRSFGLTVRQVGANCTYSAVPLLAKKRFGVQAQPQVFDWDCYRRSHRGLWPDCQAAGLRSRSVHAIYQECQYDRQARHHPGAFRVSPGSGA